ncbi:MAG: tRNA (adenosine(37)-N6)-threonylcarbamoyltransferase complex dimerization subunit type 1 TsaB [Gammaproteobacteria bacterium]|nr:tRNA (adenosine(37)-N6)-threonylcarbamoyltransferase complex dimerization subunit type 1 TsaB [Gammaproteobacteria bacterium]
MNLLALDTSADACSVALSINGEIKELFRIAPREHTHLVLPMIDELLSDAGINKSALDALAFAQGPGGFTGLRIAAGVAQGVALGLDLPLIRVSSLAALAQGIVRQYKAGQVLAAFDARMNEVYWGCYVANDAGLVERQSEEQVCRPEQVFVPGNSGSVWCGAGSGWLEYTDPLQQRLGFEVSECYADAHPHACDVATLALDKAARQEIDAADQAIPVYLRNQVVHSR